MIQKQFAALAILLIGASHGYSALVVTPTYSGTEVAFSALSNDLVQSGASTLSSVDSSQPTSYSSLAPLNDGSVGTIGTVANIYTTSIWETGPTTLTFTLNTSVNTAGYDITSIQSISSWPDIRAQQNYDLYVRTVGSSSFTLLGTANSGTNTANHSTLLTLTDSTGTLATGVDAVQFVIASVLDVPSGTLVGTAYLEFDVVGSATAVPEPSAIWILGAGLLLFGAQFKMGHLSRIRAAR